MWQWEKYILWKLIYYGKSTPNFHSHNKLIFNHMMMTKVPAFLNIQDHRVVHLYAASVIKLMLWDLSQVLGMTMQWGSFLLASFTPNHSKGVKLNSIRYKLLAYNINIHVGLYSLLSRLSILSLSHPQKQSQSFHSTNETSGESHWFSLGYQNSNLSGIVEYVNVQSCLLLNLQYKPISLQYSWLSVEQPVRIECCISIIWNFQINKKTISMLACPIDLLHMCWKLLQTEWLYTVFRTMNKLDI